MREKLTENDVILLMTFAEQNMKMQRTADELHYSVRTVFSKLCSIYARTGINPREFWGLVDLLHIIGEKGENRWKGDS